MARPQRDQLDGMLRSTLDDRRLSRGEKRAAKEVFADFDLNDDDRAYVRNRVFAIAREQLTSHDAREILDWAEDVVKLLRPDLARDPTVSDVRFSPGDECRLRIASLLENAKRSVDICVFTITDDRLTAEIVAAHRRGVAVRVISDNDKADDRGSDVERLSAAGLSVRVDRSEHHMHHKFAIFDGEFLLTGSYNWTRGAARYNRENIVVTDDPVLVTPFIRNFEEFWAALGPRR